MATNNVTPSPALAEGQEKITYKKRAFDLNKFERVSLEGELVFTPAKSLEEVLVDRVNGDEKKLLELVNRSLKREEVNEAKATLVASKGNPDLVSSAKAIMQFAANFYTLPQFAKETDKKKRKTAVFAFIRSNEPLMAALKTIANAIPVTDEDDEEDED